MADNKAVVTYETPEGKITLSPSIIKKYLVSGDSSKVTEQEVMMFLSLCKYQKLNPFLREAYLIKFGTEPATMVTGKETFTKRASSSEHCGGWEAGVIIQKDDGSTEQRKGTLVLENEKLVGGWARVYRKDWKVSLDNTVSLKEYQRRKKNGELMANWKNMPATMIRKVALVQALREAMPQEFAGLYSPEEMQVDAANLDDTPVEVEVVNEGDNQSAQSENEKSKDNPDMATQKQRKQMADLAVELSMKPEEMQKLLKEHYGVSNSKELTHEQANKVVEYLKSVSNGDDIAEDFLQNSKQMEMEGSGAQG